MAEIHLFAGLASSIVPGLRRPIEEMERLVDALAAARAGGVDAHTHVWDRWRDVREGLEAKRRAGTLAGPIVFISHSQGRVASGELCAWASSRGVRIDYLAEISPTLAEAKPVTAAVAHVDEFYEAVSLIALGRIFGGGRVRYASDFRGSRQVFNNLSGGHVGVARNERLRKAIVGRIGGLLR